MSLQGKAIGSIIATSALTAAMLSFPIAASATESGQDGDTNNNSYQNVFLLFKDDNGVPWLDLDGDQNADGPDADKDGNLDYYDRNMNGIPDDQEADSETNTEGKDETGQDESENEGENADGKTDGDGQELGDDQDTANAGDENDSKTDANGKSENEGDKAVEGVTEEAATSVVAPADQVKATKQKKKKKSKKKSKKTKDEKDADKEKLNLYGINDDVYPYQSGGVYLGSRAHTDYTTEKFIATIAEQARIYANENDLYASVLIAQAVLESGNGNSGLAQAPNFNLFGIKGSYKGESVVMRTSEDAGDGSLYDIDARFRRYPSTAESIGDYVKLLNTDLYRNARKSVAKNYRKACESLQGVYATSTTYAQSLISLIETYGLDEYDKPLKYKPQGKIYDPDSKKAGKNGYRKMTMDDYAALEAEVTSHIGMPYVWGGSDVKTGFDCSGLVQYCYKQALDIDLSRTTFTQQYEGVEVPLNVNDLRMGDLLFFVDEGQGTHHVAMYLSNGYYVHAPQTGDVVKVTSMAEFKPTFAKRIIQFDDQPAKAADTLDVDDLIKKFEEETNGVSDEESDEKATDEESKSKDSADDGDDEAEKSDDYAEAEEPEKSGKSEDSEKPEASDDSDGSENSEEDGGKLTAGKIATMSTGHFV